MIGIGESDTNFGLPSSVIRLSYMKNKKLCCRIFPVILILISTILGGAIWYYEEGIHSFTFLRDFGEFINFIGTVLFIAIIPIGLGYYLVGKEKYEKKARQLALLGFIPALVVLALILL